MKKSPRKSTPVAPTKIADVPHTQLVRLNYVNPDAKSVFVAGSFNEWHPAVTEMIDLGGGRWAKELTLDPGTYTYRLVVDGEWLPDPESSELVPNPFGSYDSVLNVPPPPAKQP